jgi:hypothetical protein
MSNPATFYIVSAIINCIKPLKLITHMILIPLSYPANLQDFFSKIFPLITFDLIPTDKLYELIFKPYSFYDSALDENFDVVGYNDKLVINNMGSLFILIILQPICLGLYRVSSAFFKDMTCKNLSEFNNKRMK